MDLQQFITREKDALKLIKLTQEYMKENKISIDLWIEPSVGDSLSFFKHLPTKQRLGFEIDNTGHNNDIHYVDFLKTSRRDFIKDNVSVGFIGNPPFRIKKTQTAKNFLVHALEEWNAVFVAFIMPPMYKSSIKRDLRVPVFYHIRKQKSWTRKYNLHKRMFTIPTVFQIWAKTHVKRRLNKFVILSKKPSKFPYELRLLKLNDITCNILLRRWGNPKNIGQLSIDRQDIINHIDKYKNRKHIRPTHSTLFHLHVSNPRAFKIQWDKNRHFLTNYFTKIYPTGSFTLSVAEILWTLQHQ
jgi:hypothetical protein